MRSAFTLIISLFILLISLSVTAALVLQFTNSTHYSYQNIQTLNAKSLANSSKDIIKYALFMHDFNATSRCINSLDITFQTLHAKAFLAYHGMPAHYTCNRLSLDTNSTTPYVRIDVNIFTNNNKNLYHYRFLEKVP